jgi:hypothetical protein
MPVYEQLADLALTHDDGRKSILCFHRPLKKPPFNKRSSTFCVISSPKCVFLSNLSI